MCADHECISLSAADTTDVNVSLSFARELFSKALSGTIYLIHAVGPSGERFSCETLAGFDLRDQSINQLREPRYVEFNWGGGGTFFPDIPLQSVHVVQPVIAAAEGYLRLKGDGPRTALGCLALPDLSPGIPKSVTISLTSPVIPWEE